MNDSPESRRIRGREAKQLMENPLLKDAFAAVGAYIDEQALSCKLEDKDRAQMIIASKRLLESIKREIMRKIEDGEIAEIQIAEIEEKRRLRLFRR